MLNFDCCFFFGGGGFIEKETFAIFYHEICIFPIDFNFQDVINLLHVTFNIFKDIKGESLLFNKPLKFKLRF